MRGIAASFDGPVWVHYGQVVLECQPPGPPPDWSVPAPAGVAGLVHVWPGHAVLATGLHTGTVRVAVDVAGGDPGAARDDYEDIVEVDFEAPAAGVALVEWGGSAIHRLPPLPAGPGTCRLRWHARGMDAARAADTNPDPRRPIDEYLLQLWPSAPAPPAVLRLTSAAARTASGA